jgi:hypothetical protein
VDLMTERPLVESTFIEQDLAQDNARLQQEVAHLEKTVTQLRYALDHRPDTDRVVGMIMLVASCGEETAWSMLAGVSQHTNRKARDVAALISAQVAAGHGLPPDLVTALGDVLPPRDRRRLADHLGPVDVPAPR